MAKYKIKVQYTFEGVFEIEADSLGEAKEDVLAHCGVTLGEINSSLIDDTVDWDFNPHPVQTEIVSAIYPDGFYENDIDTVYVVDGKAFIIDTADPLSYALESVYDLSKFDLQDLADPENELEYLGTELPHDRLWALRKVMTLVYVHLCEEELSRLNCDTATHPYSGLSIDSELLDEDGDDYNYPIKVYDDYASSVCDAEEFYSELKQLKFATLESDSGLNIWLLPCLQKG